ncbi:MAG TPA: LysR family transcriptional regulator [Rhizomicrobium sp.]|jgi:molybdate transport repressor ModE-like protein|nr:LysR family transcriptional regulator [Rhizomicrobium sp.]
MEYPHTKNEERFPAAMPDWDDFRLLLSVVQLGSFSRAAASLGIQQPTVSRRIERLEETLGVRLMDRTSRGAVLTAEGQRLVAQLNIAHDAFLRAVQGAQSADARLDDVKVLTTDGIAVYWLVRFLPRLFEMHADLEMRIFTTTDFEAEQRGHFDLSIHYTQPTNPNLITTRLGTLHFIPYGSPLYFAKHGRPASTADLAHHRLLDYILYIIDKGTWMTRLPAALGEGRAQLFTNSSAALAESVRAGAGIALLPTYGSVFEQGLEPLEVGMHFETPFWVCYKQEAAARRSVRIAVAFLKHIFNRRTMPWFGEHYVSPRAFPVVTPAQIMAGLSTAPTALAAPPEVFGSA